MTQVYIGILYGVMIAGLGVLLTIALRMLPTTPRAILLKRVSIAYVLLVIGILLLKDYFL